MSKKRKILIGTSGWIYSHWNGIFYPERLSSKDKLLFYSKHFKTTEINYSFYHLPRKTTFQNWYEVTPKDFIFSVKGSRFITHIKRLKDVEDPLKVFIENAKELKEKLGPILFQFPPSFKIGGEGLEKFKNFLKLLKKYKLSFAFEFRHKSWFQEKIYNLLRKYNFALVIADSSRYPKAEVSTADFVYFRFHGPGSLFSSKYSKTQLKKFAQLIKKFLKEKKDIFCYFNNDFSGYAIENAKELIKLLK